MAKLVLSAHGNLLHQYFIDGERLTIGADAGNDIVVNDPAVQPFQAVILAVGEDHILQDLQEAGGLFVNGAPASRQILQHRDTIELGEHHLCYMNSRIAAEVDLDRTMLIAALPRGEQGEPPSDAAAPEVALPAARSQKVRFPVARLRTVGSAEDPKLLDRVVTLLGVAGRASAVITRRPHGFTLTPLEGAAPRVNGKSIPPGPYALRDRDAIEVAEIAYMFLAASPAA